METHILLQFEGTPIRASVHRSGRPDAATIIYIHGGGGIYGSRDDLPAAYIRLFTDSGYHVVSLDYLLAPESTLDETLPLLHRTLRAVLDGGVPGLTVDPDRSVLMGRSAGTFLAVQMVAKLVREDGPVPAALLAFYGFGSLDYPEFRTPGASFTAFARVDERTYAASISPHRITEGPLAERFSMYVYHRQRGTWIDTLLGDLAIAETQVGDDEFRRFPPTLLLQSIYDPDVPFRAAKDLARKVPRSTLIRIYESELHDFDRDPKAQTGMPVYRDVVAWLGEHLAG